MRLPEKNRERKELIDMFSTNNDSGRFRVVVLSENTLTKDGEEKGLKAEHGLSLYIENDMNTLLVDAGQSDAFAENAKKLDIDLSNVKYAILSHGHYDHADGFETFFDVNNKAKLYMRREVSENCYSEKAEGIKYIGPKKGMLDKYRERIVKVDSPHYTIDSCNTVLLPHTTEGLAKLGAKARLFKESDGNMVPDDFDHEQTLLLNTVKGYVIFNSCSHAGAANILREVRDYLTGDATIYAYIGGFHLMHSTDEEVREFAESIRHANVQRLITGHCTGERAYEILKDELGDCVERMHVGMEI